MNRNMQVVLGMGCDRNTSLKTLRAAVKLVLTEQGLDHDQVQLMATIDKKNDEAGLLDLAKLYNWPLKFYTAEQLAVVEVPNPSEVVMKYMGTPAVAEAAAMLAANAGIKSLLVEKFKYCGEDDKNATVSIVRLGNE